MITCANCGRENADNFNFCLDCGSELAAATQAPPEERTKTDPPLKASGTEAAFAGMQSWGTEAARASAPSKGTEAAFASAPSKGTEAAFGSVPDPASFGEMDATLSTSAAAALNAPLPAAPEPVIGSPIPPPTTAEQVPCPKCNHPNSPGMKFCGQCGHRLDEAGEANPAGGAGKTMFMHAADMTALQKPKARLITIDQAGKEGMTFNLTGAETICGRTNGTILFFDDPFVSPTHCLFLFEDGLLAVQDQDSLNGVFSRIRTSSVLEEGDMLRLGRQLFRLEVGPQTIPPFLTAREGDDARLWGSPDPESWARLAQILDDGTAGEVHLLCNDECRIGREVGDILLPNDGFISASHCALSLVDGKVTIRDLGSSNGTYVRIRAQRELTHDDFILIGNQMLRVEIR